VLITFLSFAFVLGVLVFVHELGHFLAAKRVGIKVLKFQLGFNPTIVSIRRGDTEYGIGALPLGGYVKMAGESPEEERTGRSDEFLSKTKWQRFQVLVMGPVMNLLLAFLLTAVVLYKGAEKPAYEDEPVVVGSVTANSPAAQAGIRPHDHIVAIDDRPVNTWDDFYLFIGTRPNRETSIRIQRDGRDTTTTLTPAVAPGGSRFEIGEIGVVPTVRPTLIHINPGEPGDKGGLRVGDVVLAFNGQPMSSPDGLRETISKTPAGSAARVTVLRDGHEQDLTVTLKTGCSGVAPTSSCMGVGIGQEMKRFQPGLGEAFVMSAKKNVQYAGLIFQTIGGLITRETSPKQLMGPVAIAQLSGEAAQLSMLALFSLMASLSLNLGLLNLLPIPVLDGGHIFIMALEGIARRDFSVRVKEKMLLAGFAVLMMLMVTVIYNDLTRISWIERLMPWR
jgi:regulator of sigma E protease